MLTSCSYFIFIDGNCGSNWKCSDNMCIARDLYCDKVAHCLDVSDEVVNCSNSGLCVQVPRIKCGPVTVIPENVVEISSFTDCFISAKM